MGFRAPGNDEFTKTKFAPAAEDTYRVTVDGYEIKTGPDSASKWNPDGNPRVWFFLTPTAIDGDEEAELVDTAGEVLPEDKRFIFFFDPDHIGTYKGRVSKSRKFMAALLGIPNDQPVEYDTLEAFCDDAVGRELIVDITVKGEYNNIEDTRMLKKRARKRTERTPLVEEAAKVFTEEAPEVAEETTQEEY